MTTSWFSAASTSGEIRTLGRTGSEARASTAMPDSPHSRSSVPTLSHSDRGWSTTVTNSRSPSSAASRSAAAPPCGGPNRPWMRAEDCLSVSLRSPPRRPLLLGGHGPIFEASLISPLISMDPKKARKLRAEIAALRRKVGIRTAQLEGLAQSLGRERHKRGEGADVGQHGYPRGTASQYPESSRRAQQVHGEGDSDAARSRPGPLRCNGGR